MRYCSRCLKCFETDPASCPSERCRAARPATGWPHYLEPGATVDGRFRLDETTTVLGAGGAGITYLAEDRKEGGLVALKVLHGDRRRGALAQRFLVEADALQLFEHPHIVSFRALNLVREPYFYLATRYLPGGALEEFVRSQGPLSPSLVCVVGRQIALALHAVHDAGIIHRDLKPGNVFIEDVVAGRPIVRLGDFGIARMWRPSGPSPAITRTGAFVGTPEYAAPEQLRGEKVISSAVDAYALGALLHFLALGRHLVGRAEVANWDEFKQGVGRPGDRPRLASLLDDIDDDAERVALLDTIIDQLRDPSPHVRPDMAEVARAFGADADELRKAVRGLSPQATLYSIGHDDGWDVEGARSMFAAEEVGDEVPVAPLSAAPGPEILGPGGVSSETDEGEDGGRTDEADDGRSAGEAEDEPSDKGSSFQGGEEVARPVAAALRTAPELATTLGERGEDAGKQGLRGGSRGGGEPVRDVAQGMAGRSAAPAAAQRGASSPAPVELSPRDERGELDADDEAADEILGAARSPSRGISPQVGVYVAVLLVVLVGLVNLLLREPAASVAAPPNQRGQYEVARPTEAPARGPVTPALAPPEPTPVIPAVAPALSTTPTPNLEKSEPTKERRRPERTKAPPKSRTKKGEDGKPAKKPTREQSRTPTGGSRTVAGTKAQPPAGPVERWSRDPTDKRSMKEVTDRATAEEGIAQQSARAASLGAASDESLLAEQDRWVAGYAEPAATTEKPRPGAKAAVPAANAGGSIP